MDPWLSPAGAFDSAWFQLPRNHHLAAFVQEKLGDKRKERFIYISHEHKDHFDPAFLGSLHARDFTFVIPRYRREALRHELARFPCKEVVTCSDREEVRIPGGSLKLFLDDTELNRDSAVLVRESGRVFFNMNDCKLHDAIPDIAREEGAIDVFACQFSGATWHPTCYEYPRERYEAISRKKVLTKFEATAQAIQAVNPRVYIPSAGPAAFLDPTLIHLNFEPVNIFPRAPKLIEYLQRRLPDATTAWPELMPGDILDVASGKVVYAGKQRVTEENFEAYVREYAAAYEGFFRERQLLHPSQDVEKVLEWLRLELGRKLEHLTLHDRIQVPLYFQLSDVPAAQLRVDFQRKVVEAVPSLQDATYYRVSAPSWEVARVLDGKLTWEDFALTFRLRLDREPDMYQTLVQGFLIMEPEDLDPFCAKLLNLEKQQERITVEAEGRRFVVNRFCPHSGADLTCAWIEQGRYLTCPRHRWQFDLERGGRCLTNATSVDALCIDGD